MMTAGIQDKVGCRNVDYRARQAAKQDRKTADCSDAQGFSNALKKQEPEIDPEDNRTLRQKMADMIAKLNEKVQNGETEQSFQIGAQSFTIKQWERMMEEFDAAQEEIREQQRSRQGERLKEKVQQGVADLTWMDNRYAEEGVTQKDAASLTVEEMLAKILMDMDDPDERQQAGQDGLDEGQQAETVWLE